MERGIPLGRRALLGATGAAAAGALAGCTSRSPATVHPDADVVTRDQATAVVTSRSGLKEELDAAESGDVVFIPPTVTIDLTGMWQLIVPGGVTLAGGRGIRGPRGPLPGALLHSQDGDEPPGRETYAKFILDKGARLTGLRLRGHHHEYVNPQYAYDGDYYAHRGDGVAVPFEGEVDNNEIYDWVHAAVSVDDSSHVHHNHIHHNTWEGLGYGVSVGTGGMPIIEHNYFNYNRHSINGAGDPRTSYVARYNVVGPEWMGHPFDMHGTEDGDGGIAGDRIEIHHNTFQNNSVLSINTRDPGPEPAIKIRGTPTTGVWIERNWFYHDTREGAYTQYGGLKKVHFSKNHYGTNEPSDPDVGAPQKRGGLF